MRQRAAGSLDHAPTAAASHDAAKTGSSALVPFHPPAAALLVSPAVDLSSSSVFGLPAAEVAQLFKYDYVTKREAADAGGRLQLHADCIRKAADHWSEHEAQAGNIDA